MFYADGASRRVFVKRIIGMPGEWVKARQGRISICTGPGGSGCVPLVEPYVRGTTADVRPDRRAAGPLLRDGRQPPRLRGLARLGPGAARPAARDVHSASSGRRSASASSDARVCSVRRKAAASSRPGDRRATLVGMAVAVRQRPARKLLRPGHRLLRHDRALGVPFVAGTDEAGRGALAGPLVAAGVLFDYRRLQGRVCASLAQLDDSKTRTLDQREELYDAVLACATRVSVIFATAREVDRARRAPRQSLGAGAGAARARRAVRAHCSCPTASACRSSASTARSSAATARALRSRRPRSSPRSRATASCGACTRRFPTTASTATSATRRRSTAMRCAATGPCPLHRRSFVTVRRAAALPARGLMARAHALGRRGETLAAWLVRLRGGRVIARNVRVRGACEVDIVARYGRTLAVVEVKARRAGGAGEAVGRERVAGLSPLGGVAGRQSRLRVGAGDPARSRHDRRPPRPLRRRRVPSVTVRSTVRL